MLLFCSRQRRAVHVKRIAVAGNAIRAAGERSNVGIRRQRPGAALIQRNIDRAGFRRDLFALRVYNLPADAAFEGGAVLQGQRQGGAVSGCTVPAAVSAVDEDAVGAGSGGFKYSPVISRTKMI